jgi:hypothetical protein
MSTMIADLNNGADRLRTAEGRVRVPAQGRCGAGITLADAIARLCLMQAMMQAITIQQTGSQ